jgi:hypothetical protein
VFDPPDQLRVRNDLDGLHIKVSGRPWSIFDAIRSPSFQTVGWSVVILLCLVGLAGFAPAFGLAAIVTLLTQASPLLEPTRGALETELTLTPNQLVLVVDGERTEVPWNQVGIVSVERRAQSVTIRRALTEPLKIPMELEPPDHAVWLATTLEDRAKAARRQRGSAADVPASIRKIRN